MWRAELVRDKSGYLWFHDSGRGITRHASRTGYALHQRAQHHEADCPLFLNDLEEAFQVAKDSEKKLKALLLRISKMKFFDPACGSGNFLIIAYKELRNLEIRIWKQIREVTGQAIIPFVTSSYTSSMVSS